MIILFLKRIGSSKRKYYFHVKKAENGSKYLVIGEQVIRKNQSEYEVHRIMIFDDIFNEFVNAINEIKEHMK
ncbi:MAG: DUF3276 family protein [Candidatus Goldbacteria bacterium]|nr:DUF3276 family protein [Candidatus Goldiibacteriota bacterium]